MAPTNESIFLGNRWQKRDQVSMKLDGGSLYTLYRPRMVSSIPTKSGSFREIEVSMDVYWTKANVHIVQPCVVKGIVKCIAKMNLARNMLRLKCRGQVGRDWIVQGELQWIGLSTF